MTIGLFIFAVIALSIIGALVLFKLTLDNPAMAKLLAQCIEKEEEIKVGGND